MDLPDFVLKSSFMEDDDPSSLTEEPDKIFSIKSIYLLIEKDET